MKTFKIWEIATQEGKRFIDNFGEEWVVRRGDLFNNANNYIFGTYTIQDVIEMDFFEQTPLTLLKTDDKILVSDDNRTWHYRYFSHLENGKIRTFPCGATSWSNFSVFYEAWEYFQIIGEETD